MLDNVELMLYGGNGGNGAVAFRREKYVPFGGPFGGNGGKGGDVIIKANEDVSTLRAYQHKRVFKSESGQNGMSGNKTGKDGSDIILKVPPGTLVYKKSDTGNTLIADLAVNGQEVVAVRGGRGGWGNTHYATPTNQTPRIAQPGKKGEEAPVVLEMRLIADAGIIGFPNVGKSSLVTAISGARPEIADYPFTTLEPVLGVVEMEDGNYVMAEIPGLIAGAHLGKGLGYNFLRHAMRTRVLIHLLDGSSDSPAEDMLKVNLELGRFNPELGQKPQLIAINKIDMPEVKKRLKTLQSTFKQSGIIPVFISAATGEGLEELKNRIWELLKSSESRLTEKMPVTTRIFRPRAVNAGGAKKGKTLIFSDPKLELLLNRLDLSNPEDRKQFYQHVEKMGIKQVLEAAGARSGDTIRTGKKEWKLDKYDNWYHGRNI